MVKQAISGLSTTRLSDGEYTQTGRETLKELIRVHFPDSTQIDDPNDGQGQQYLDIHSHTLNSRDCSLAINVINQSNDRSTK
jgi:hypothetical protein